jgi:hypothetical protein
MAQKSHEKYKISQISATNQRILTKALPNTLILLLKCGQLNTLSYAANSVIFEILTTVKQENFTAANFGVSRIEDNSIDIRVRIFSQQ